MAKSLEVESRYPQKRGPAGLSSYEIAVAAGFVGDRNAWLATLGGIPGPKGDPGSPDTPDQIAAKLGQATDPAAIAASQDTLDLYTTGELGGPETDLVLLWNAL